MLNDNNTEGKDLRFINRALLAWIILAGVLLPVLSLILHCCKAEYVIVSYCSSALSFLCSVGAGAMAQKHRGGGAVYTGLIIGIMLCIGLLTIGFLICGGKIQSDGVISVASFSITGALTGSVLCSRKGSKSGPKGSQNPGKKRKKGILT